MPEWLVYGHRGNGRGPDENTLKGFRQALRQGADGIETDVRMVGRRLVCAHGKAGRSSPLLADVLAEFRVPVIVHVKRRRFNPLHDRRVVERLADMRTGRDRMTVSSCWAGTVRFAKKKHGFRTAFISHWPWYDLHLARRLMVDEFHGWHALIGQRTERSAARKGLRLVAFGASRQSGDFLRLRNLGVGGVITDTPGWAAKYRDRPSG